MKKYSYLFVALVSYIFCNSISACTIPPDIRHTHETVVDGSKNIILAKAVSYEPRFYMNQEIVGFVNFETIEILKGSAPDKFRIKAWERELKSTIWTSFRKYTFNYNHLNHNDKYFWKENTGRVTTNNSMCILVPDFSIGYTYLIIDGKRQDSKDYELITFKSDKWLLYVRNKLEEENIK